MPTWFLNLTSYHSCWSAATKVTRKFYIISENDKEILATYLKPRRVLEKKKGRGEWRKRQALTACSAMHWLVEWVKKFHSAQPLNSSWIRVVPLEIKKTKISRSETSSRSGRSRAQSFSSHPQDGKEEETSSCTLISSSSSFIAMELEAGQVATQNKNYIS